MAEVGLGRGLGAEVGLGRGLGAEVGLGSNVKVLAAFIKLRTLIHNINCIFIPLLTCPRH